MKLISVLWILGCFLFSQSLCAEGDFSNKEQKKEEPKKEEQIKAEQIKAGYLYNFTKFITWPADNAETFNLCILGDDPFGERIDPIEKKSAMGRPIKLFRFDSLGSMDKGPHCHILFVSSSIKESLAVRNFDNTLVVGEGGEFIKHGGMIGFVVKPGKTEYSGTRGLVKDPDKVKLHINRPTIIKSGLEISSKLLEAAEVLIGEDSND